MNVIFKHTFYSKYKRKINFAKRYPNISVAVWNLKHVYHPTEGKTEACIPPGHLNLPCRCFPERTALTPLVGWWLILAGHWANKPRRGSGGQGPRCHSLCWAVGESSHFLPHFSTETIKDFFLATAARFHDAEVYSDVTKPTWVIFPYSVFLSRVH